MRFTDFFSLFRAKAPRGLFSIPRPKGHGYSKAIPILLFVFTFSSFAQNQIEIVESVPIETNLDNPDIRNTQEVWLEMINGAKSTLDIEQFYISNEKGEALDTIINAIVAAGERGVKVRIIVDAGMYKTYPETVDWLGLQKNIFVVKYDVKSLTGGIQHAKFFIVDGEQVFLGSQNFDWRALSHIHEVGVRFTLPKEKNYFQALFDADYCACTQPEKLGTLFSCTGYFLHYSEPVIFKSFHDSTIVFSTSSSLSVNKKMVSDYWCRIVRGLPAYDINNILGLIKNSKSKIILQFLSYSSKDFGVIDSALTAVAKRGVKVKMIISDWNLSKDAVETFLKLQENPNIEIRYTAIPEWSGGYIPYARVEHCKFITVDSTRCWIGTSNMASSYFYNSRNVGVVIDNKKFTTRLRDIFYKSWDGPYANKIEPNGNYQIRFHREKN